MKIAFLFPGQGSQHIGMGRDLYEAFSEVRELFEMACDMTHTDITRLCFEGPLEELNQTVNLQPAVTAVNLACLAPIAGELTPHAAAGHSLGEFSALACAGVLSRQDAVKVVFRRGELMHREAQHEAGAMAAVVGADIENVDRWVTQAQARGIVSVANYNTPQQIVVTGQPDAVDAVGRLAAAGGARAVPLQVSGAWHSELMRGAEQSFAEYLDAFTFHTPVFPVIHNVTADSESDGAAIRSLMARQLRSPVRWTDSMQRMIDDGIEVFIEIGPGRVLSGLARKILPRRGPHKIYSVGNVESIERFIREALNSGP